MSGSFHRSHTGRCSMRSTIRQVASCLIVLLACGCGGEGDNNEPSTENDSVVSATPAGNPQIDMAATSEEALLSVASLTRNSAEWDICSFKERYVVADS